MRAKRIAVVLLGLLLAVSLAACQGGDKGKNNGNNGGYYSRSVSVVAG